MYLKDFLNAPGKLIITDREVNVNRKLRRWNRYDGMTFVNCRVYSTARLVREFVTAYAAYNEPDVSYRFIPGGQSDLTMHMVVRDESLQSVPAESKSLETSKQIMRVLDQVRLNRATAAFEGAIDVKASEMKKIIRLYEDRLRERNQLDYPMTLDKGIGYLDELLKGSSPRDALFFYLPYMQLDVGVTKDMKVTEKERIFLEKLEAALGKKFERDLSFASDSAPEYRFFRAYGIEAEVRYVADRIKEEKLLYGDVFIMYASPSYENMIRGVFEEAGISYSFPAGTHATSEDFVCFMQDLIDFVKNDYSYEALDAVVSNPIAKTIGENRKKSYRKILDAGIGWKRERYEDYVKEHGDDEENSEFLEFLKRILDVFDEKNSCGVIFSKLVQLAKDYTRKNDKIRIDLTEELRVQTGVFLAAADDMTFEERLDCISGYLMQLMVSGTESPDAVAVYPYGTFAVTDRNDMFVLGLSNENISGVKTQSPVFTDEELRRYAEGFLNLPSERSYNAVQDFKRTLECFDGKKVRLGYCEFDTVALLDCSSSLIYRELMNENGVTEDKIEQAGYKLIKGTVRVDKDDFYAAASVVSDEEAEKTAKDMPSDTFSATSLQTLLKCPMRYYFKYVRYVPDISFQDRNPGAWLMPAQRGNVFHHVAQKYAQVAFIDNEKHDMDEALFEKLFNEEIENMVKSQPYPSQAVFESERDECHDALKKYLEELHGKFGSGEKKIIGCEAEFEDVPYSDELVIYDEQEEPELELGYDIKLTGSIDRIDGYVEDGILKVLITDYKTGNPDNIRKALDSEKQIQHYVYAIGFKQWFEKNRDELSTRFGTDINGYSVEGMKYVFPFEKDGCEIDVSAGLVTPDGREITLPENLHAMLGLVTGLIQRGDTEKALEYIERACPGHKAEEINDNCKYCTYMKICMLRKRALSNVGA